MAAAWLTSSNLFIVLVSVVGICAQARAELYEIPLPVTGEYTLLRQFRNFEVSLGFPLEEVQSVRFKVMGTMTATLSENALGQFVRPWDGRIAAALFDGPEHRTFVFGPRAGLDTYPEPESFAGEVSFASESWDYLRAGTFRGYTYMVHTAVTTGDVEFLPGVGKVTAASLLVEATPVPEPGLTSMGAVAMLGLLRRWKPPLINLEELPTAPTGAATEDSDVFVCLTRP
jgi:hypothetical protein